MRHASTIVGLALTSALLGSSLSIGAARADYEPRKPPVTSHDRTGEVTVRDLTGTGVTRRQARSADILKVRYAKDGDTVVIRTTLRRILRNSPQYVQVVDTYLDEEQFVSTAVSKPGTPTRVGGVGYGPGAPLRTCRRATGWVAGNVLIQRFPETCPFNAAPEVAGSAFVRSLGPRRSVSSDGIRSTYVQLR